MLQSHDFVLPVTENPGQSSTKIVDSNCSGKSFASVLNLWILVILGFILLFLAVIMLFIAYQRCNPKLVCYKVPNNQVFMVPAVTRIMPV